MGGGDEKCVQNVEEPEGERRLDTPTRRWDDKLGLKETGCEDVD